MVIYLFSWAQISRLVCSGMISGMDVRFIGKHGFRLSSLFYIHRHKGYITKLCM